MRALLSSVTAVLLVASSAAADSVGPASLNRSLSRPADERWSAGWTACTDDAAEAVSEVSHRGPALRLEQASLFRQDAAQPLHAVAVEHSTAYQTRGRIHKYASYATLPLFAAEVALGQSLNGSDNGRKGAHAAVGAGLVGLFAVNTVTGAWNLFGDEGRQDTEGRRRRVIHGLLMMAADVGFVATTASAPGGRNDAASFDANRSTHRNLAIASVSVGTAGYLLMLFGK